MADSRLTTEMNAPTAILCTVLLERPALIVNKIKALARLKINAEMLRKVVDSGIKTK